MNGRQILVARTVLGAHGSLLVELAQVPEVVDAVANVLGARLPLVGRRHPHRGKALLREARGHLGETPPVLAVCWEVPGEGLEHEPVLRVDGHGLPTSGA